MSTTLNFEVLYRYKLGRGRFGDVYLAKSADQTFFAAKKVEPIQSSTATKAGSVELEAAEREIKVLEKLNHPNIVRLEDSMVEKDRCVWLFMEFSNMGSLEDYFRQYYPVDEAAICKFCIDMVKGLSYLHDKLIVHRDIKPSNILVFYGEEDTFPVAKISDFGVSKAVESSSGLPFEYCAKSKGAESVGGDSEPQNISFNTLKCGTETFEAPEMFSQDESASASANQKVDIFALGLTYFCMICRPKNKDILSLFPWDPEIGIEMLESVGERIHEMRVNLPNPKEADEAIRHFRANYFAHHEQESKLRSVLVEMVLKMTLEKPTERFHVNAVLQRLLMAYEEILGGPDQMAVPLGITDGVPKERTIRLWH